MDLLILDCETTDGDAGTGGILEIACEFHQNGKRISGICKKFKPEGDININLGALRANSIDFGAIDCRGSEKIAVQEFVDYLLGLPKDIRIVICGHNVYFDMEFIKALLRKYKITGLNAIFSRKRQDTSTIGYFLNSVGIIDWDIGGNLESLAKALNIELPNTKGLPEEQLHNAGVDVKITAKVYYKMQRLITNMKIVADEAQLVDDEE